MKYNGTLIIVLLLAFQVSLRGQSEDEKMIKQIFDYELSNGESYEMLDYLSNQIGGRLSGSPQAAAAVEWSRQVMMDYNFDTVFLQEVMVPHWVRGKKEVARIINSKTLGTRDMDICALGNSVSTGGNGILANVVEVKTFKELEDLGAKNIKGKIVFFNRPMDASQIHTFMAYGGAVGQRVQGASEAAKYGAVGVVVRSMASNLDDIPHTGTLRYDPDLPQLPAVAISTNEAELLSATLKKEKDLKFYLETYCEMLPDVLSYNVIGEMKGSQYPNEYIVVGGHLDSWDLGDGAHDDGSGCVQSIEAMRILKSLNYKPRRSLRVVMFMNEENGLRGGNKYAEEANKNEETHIAALESDSGGFSPRGFRMSGDDEPKEKIRSWMPLFKPYGIYDFDGDGGGADIGPLLKSQNTTVIGLMPDSQRYFNYHHTVTDTFDKIDKRELELGAAGMTALIYMIDKHGLK